MDAARQAGLVGVRRVLDSTPLYDAVATQDTVTLLGAAIRGVLKVADQALEAELRGVLASGEEYASLAKPQVDWDDQAARAAPVDARARDAHALLGVLQARLLPTAVAEAARLLAAVVGQDLEPAGDGRFRIARKVAADRLVSVVDPDARHGHKTSARGFDGYKAHASVDPDSELVTATTATAGNVGDATPAPGLLAELVDQVHADLPASGTGHGPPSPQPAVYGDGAYGTGPLLASLHAAGVDPRVKAQAPVAPGGHFTKDQFQVDLAAGTITCPAGRTAPITTTPTPPPPPRPGQLRPGVCDLPAWEPVHQGGEGPHHHHHRLRGRADRCACPPGRPPPGRRLPRHPPQGGAKAGPPGPPPPRRPPRAGPRPGQGHRRPQPAGRRGQPGPPGRARPALGPIGWLGGGMSQPGVATSGSRATRQPARHPHPAGQPTPPHLAITAGGMLDHAAA